MRAVLMIAALAVAVPDRPAKETCDHRGEKRQKNDGDGQSPAFRS